MGGVHSTGRRLGGQPLKFIIWHWRVVVPNVVAIRMNGSNVGDCRIGLLLQQSVECEIAR